MKKCNWPELRVTPSFCLVLTVASICDRSGFFPYMLFTISVHEMGHLLMMLVLGCPVQQLSFRAFGIEIKGELPTDRRCAQIMLAGPCANLLTVFFLLPFAQNGNNIAVNLFTCSFLLGIFHLLPLNGLDGAAALLSLTKEHRITCCVCNGLTILAVMIFAFVGIYLIFISGNPSLLVLSTYFFLNFLSTKTKSI